VTLARDLHNLRLAQRSTAYSPRLPQVGQPPSGEWSGQAERMRFARLIQRRVRAARRTFGPPAPAAAIQA
jgi:hypothetical protein